MRKAHLVFAIAILLSGAAWMEMRAITPREAHVRAEIDRLRTHFDIVDTELRARDASALTPDRRARRDRLIEWLRDYRHEGEFPVNAGHADVAVPIFRDADARLCAMAYLIGRSGRGDIVERIASERNTAYVRELTDDPELVAWLDDHGLTAAEAGRIQPFYGPIPEEPHEEPDNERVSAHYALASMALSGASLVTSHANITDASQLAGMLGLVAGASTAAAGVLRLDEDGGTRTIAVANTAVGVFAIGAALHGLHSLRGADGQPSASRVRVGGAELKIAPGIINVADRSRLGFVLAARF
jgi:hypothetical protein